MSERLPPELRHFDRYICGILAGKEPYDYADKPRNLMKIMSYMLNRTQSMFRWSGLPDTIPQRVLELYLQTNGNVCFYRHEGELYVFVGGLGGEPDVYYMPTIYTIANPALKLSKNLRINEECIVIPNDSMYLGLLPLNRRYATGLVETELSINLAAINSRVIDLIAAPDDRTRASAEKFLADVAAGKLGVIAENAFLEGISTHPYAAAGNRTITDLIELEQYVKASWYNEIGLNANYNMKRESINSGESQLNNDALLPLVDDMLRCRQLGAEKVNAMFGTSLSVEFSSSWEDNEDEIELQQEQLGGEPEPDPEQDEEGGEDNGDEAPPTD